MGQPAIPVPLALAARRGLLAGGVLAAALAAHLSALADTRLIAGAPALWLALIAVAALVGPRRGWRPRHPGTTFAAALTGQLALHMAMSVAPWAFGMSAHHASGLAVDPRALIPHLVAAGAIAALLAVFDALLGGVRRIAGALIRVLERRPSRSAVRPSGRVAAPHVRIPRGPAGGAFASRGPPPVLV